MPRLIWISLGGVAATVLLTVCTLIWYARTDRTYADATLAGIVWLIALQSANHWLFDRIFRNGCEC